MALQDEEALAHVVFQQRRLQDQMNRQQYSLGMGDIPAPKSPPPPSPSSPLQGQCMALEQAITTQEQVLCSLVARLQEVMRSLPAEDHHSGSVPSYGCPLLDRLQEAESRIRRQTLVVEALLEALVL